MSLEPQKRHADHWYDWQGTDYLGLPQHGDIQASSHEHAINLLARSGVRNINLKERQGVHGDRKIR